MENSMSHTLKIKAFFFNAKTDYLPYYKNFNITVDDNATAKDMLIAIQAQNENFSFPKQKLIMKINGLVVEAKQSIGSIVEKLGTSLQIDPANSYRSKDGLKMNDDDFMQSFSLLEPYASEADLKYYKTLYALHYASETENFEREYIGDAVLVLAHKMISEGNAHKTEILNAITSVHSGLLDCEYENNLFNAQDHTQSINALKEMVKNANENEHPSLLDMIKARLGMQREPKEAQPVKRERTVKHIENLSQKRIAYHAGLSTSDSFRLLTEELEIHAVKADRTHKLSGLSILEDNPTLAFKKAGATLLNAFDAGAEVLVVENPATYDMFVNHFSKIEKTVGRKMIGLELITTANFVQQLSAIEA